MAQPEPDQVYQVYYDERPQQMQPMVHRAYTQQPVYVPFRQYSG